MSGFFDKLKPQPKNTAPASEPVIPTPVEVTKPVEVIPPKEPDFTNTQAGTPFETPMAYAQRYYEAAKETGDLTPEMQNKLAAFTEISGILADGWKAEQETDAAAEKAKDPSEKLKEILLEQAKNYNHGGQISVEENINYGFEVINKIKKEFDQAKIIHDESWKEDFPGWLEKHGAIKRINLSNLFSGQPGNIDAKVSNGGFPVQKLISAYKSLGLIPSEAPENGQYPSGKENEYLISMLKQNGETTETDNFDYPEVHAKDIKKPTNIEGVTAVITFNTSYMTESPVRGMATGIGFNLELSPKFYEKKLGINKPSELPPIPSAENI